MDSTTNNSKHKSGVSFTENNSSIYGTSNDESHWYEDHRDHRCDHGKKRERVSDQMNHVTNFHIKRKREDESQESFFNDQLLTHSTPVSPPAYNYSTNDPPYMENNHALSMTSAASVMNDSQWRANIIDAMLMVQNNMPSSSTILTTAQASGSGINLSNSMRMQREFGMIGMNNCGKFGTQEESMMVSQAKEVILFSKGMLLPPNPNAPPLSTRNKPNGCRTVFVGGLPENITEEIIKEIFEKSGEIESIRLSVKKFCHIRFKDPASIERALYYSGYELKIDNSDDTSFIGKIHVDYAAARDDQHEYECLQRRLNRIARHQEHESATPSILHYTDEEAAHIAKKLENQETFLQAACVLINWFDGGECTKQNAETFYTMIHSTYCHARQLKTKKGKIAEQLKDAKEKLKKQKGEVTRQFYEIEKIFNAACLKKVWEHFTEAQRKNIEMWKEHTEEIMNAHIEEVMNMREDKDGSSSEMDLSNDKNETSLQYTNCSMSIAPFSTPDRFSDKSENSIEDEIAKLLEEMTQFVVA